MSKLSAQEFRPFTTRSLKNAITGRAYTVSSIFHIKDPCILFIVLFIFLFISFNFAHIGLNILPTSNHKVIFLYLADGHFCIRKTHSNDEVRGQENIASFCSPLNSNSTEKIEVRIAGRKQHFTRSRLIKPSAICLQYRRPTVLSCLIGFGPTAKRRMMYGTPLHRPARLLYKHAVILTLFFANTHTTVRKHITTRTDVRRFK